MTCSSCDILYEKITRDSREAFNVMVRLNAENEDLRKENARFVRQWSADLKAATEKLEATRAANEVFARENRELWDRIEAIKSENDELGGLLTTAKREYVALFNDYNNITVQIESLKATDTAKVIDALLADKLILRDAIHTILKVAEQL